MKRTTANNKKTSSERKTPYRKCAVNPTSLEMRRRTIRYMTNLNEYNKKTRAFRSLPVFVLENKTDVSITLIAIAKEKTTNPETN